MRALCSGIVRCEGRRSDAAGDELGHLFGQHPPTVGPVAEAGPVLLPLLHRPPWPSGSKHSIPLASEWFRVEQGPSAGPIRDFCQNY